MGGWRSRRYKAVLLPPKLRRLLDAVESFQRENRVRELLGAAIQHWAGKRQEFLRHRLRIRERIRLAGGIGMKPFMHAVIGRDADARAEGMAAAGFEAIVLYDVELVGE